MHNACWHGMPAQTCLRLCAAGARVDAINKVCTSMHKNITLNYLQIGINARIDLYMHK